MKKSHKYNAVSEKVCQRRGCEKKLKARLVAIKAPHNITHCFAHEPRNRISGHSIRAYS